ncbi:hypothetical protein DXG01_012084 [Tephrocybe rancida]|nr:hypothetical protein DXG01_012084 [Tephrocybe rancida]
MSSKSIHSPGPSALINLEAFDIHPLTGFISRTAPIARLPAKWESWEAILEDATNSKLQLGAKFGITEAEKGTSEAWRSRVRELPVISIMNLEASEPLLSRAHAILAYLVHFYVHSLPSDAEACIPPSLSLPFLQVSAKLDVPPVMTYTDDIMSNWSLREPTSDGVPTMGNLRSQRSFTGISDEEAFYLAPVHVELRGAEALRLIQSSLNDIAVSRDDTTARVTEALLQLTLAFKGLKEALLSVRDGCNPDFFYRNLRPWLIGGDTDPNRKWIFEGIERDPSLKEPTYLSGSSAAQSPLIQALDGLLGVEKPQADPGANSGSITLSTPFAHRMRVYMPRRQRELLEHLTATGSALRSFVASTNDSKLSEAYNAALIALKEFRDGHMIIVTLYIIQPSKRLAKEEAERRGVEDTDNRDLKGSAGGDLASLLKDFRARTTRPPSGAPDTTTLAAHDFDVDTRTGFMPPQPPPSRLPQAWEAWEHTLDEAKRLQLKLGDTPVLPEHEILKSETWRCHVRDLEILPIDDLLTSELYLRRAHHVLGWIMHFYIHSLPPDAPVVIPPPITLPLLQVSSQLQLPPVLTYSDDVLYNWELKRAQKHYETTPALDNLRCQTLFTDTTDEEEFYLSSARIELAGVPALDLMQAIMDEIFVGDDVAIRRITEYLLSLSGIIHELRTLLLAVRDGCNPDVFYHHIRPWFRGVDSDPNKRPWVFAGIEADPSLQQPTELSGPSAGQSSLVHALDIFLGVDQYSHSDSLTGSATVTAKKAFLDRMQMYMPRHHRSFLNHLSASPRPLRAVVSQSTDTALLEAYNTAIMAVKEFRDAHMMIVALYIIGPSRKAAPSISVATVRPDIEKDYGDLDTPLKGTGGTELVKFLKDVRDRTAGAVLPLI